MFYMLKNRNFWIMVLVDAVLIALSCYFAYYLRFDGAIPPSHLVKFKQTIVWILPVKLFCFFSFDLYKGMWRYTSVHDLTNLVNACSTSSAIIVAVLLIAVRFVGFPRSVFIIDLLLTFLLVGGYRMTIRIFYARTAGQFRFPFLRVSNFEMKRLLIIGAGDAGEKLIREIKENPGLNHDVVGLVDDDVSKLKHTIHGIPVLGTLNEMDEIARKNNVGEIIIAVPSASAGEMRRIVNFCETTGLPYKTIPGIGELIEGKVSVTALREVRYDDLLGREPVDLNTEQIGGYLTGKRVLVTGGAGSIGSGLCDQIARFKPERLIIVERNESGLYDMEMNFLSGYPDLKLIPVLGPIQNTRLMGRVFREHEPEVVFHAAAYKHVPMMEMHPWEAVFNNIVGSQTLLNFCMERAVDRCVVVSTDKAVRPTSVMGASKRVVEILTQIYAKECTCRFIAVRFGNVVGSAGSVVPLFRQQIERGGPVTVTHPEVTRYFMSIPEACGLILEAGAIGRGGEIFVLKMGTPIRIVDMAHDIIRLSGFKPDEDIEIKFVGLRAGEKLYEELITEGEDILKTEHEGIMVLNDQNTFSPGEMSLHLEMLTDLALAEDEKGIKEELKRILPEYSPQI